MSIVIGSASDDGGGAAKAALRLHQALLESGAPSTMIVDRNTTRRPGVNGGTGTLSRLRADLKNCLEVAPVRLNGFKSGGPQTLGYIHGAAQRRICAAKPTLVNLHWVGEGYLSVGQIGRLPVPTVWTLHDMWPFLGAAHYDADGHSPRWKTGYVRANKSLDDGIFDLDRWTWRRKQRCWQHPLQLVAPSNWLAQCVRESELLKRWPVSVVPNALPTSTYRPHDAAFARETLGLPLDIPLLLFGAVNPMSEQRKGGSLLIEAVHCAAKEHPSMEVVVFGNATSLPRLPVKVHQMGYLHDDVSLSLLYSAADVMVVPSLLENLVQTGTEAQSCGTPLIAFDVGGMSDVVAHEVTGLLSRAVTAPALASSILSLLQDGERRRKMSAAARARAVRLWSPSVVASTYMTLFDEVLRREEDKRNALCGPRTKNTDCLP